MQNNFKLFTNLSTIVLGLTTGAATYVEMD